MSIMTKRIDQTNQAFPRELLTASADVRFRYFENCIVEHKHLQDTEKLVLSTIKRPAGTEILLVYGPAGVGKKVLIKRLKDQVVRFLLSQLETDPGRLPIAHMELVAPEYGSFNWRDYYVRALQALDEPLIDQKVSLGDRVLERQSRRQSDAASLRRSLESALYHRCPAAFLCDEAHHLATIASGRKLADQAQVIKSLANTTKTLHVLFGTKRLLTLASLNGELARREQLVHFARYRWELEEDRNAFYKTLKSFERVLPLADEPDLARHWEFCYERSIGCIGVLKSWLMRALGRALEENLETLTASDLEKTALPPKDCRIMAREALEAEEIIQSMGAGESDLRKLLGLEPPGQDKEITAPRDRNDGASTGKDLPKNPCHRLRPGERGPKRDPVGTHAQDAMGAS